MKRMIFFAKTEKKEGVSSWTETTLLVRSTKPTFPLPMIACMN